MALWRSMEGMVRVQLTSADLYGTLALLESKGISLEELEPVDAMQMILQIRRKDLPRLERLCRRRGDALQIVSREGLYWAMRGLLRRPVFLLKTWLFSILQMPGKTCVTV